MPTPMEAPNRHALIKEVIAPYHYLWDGTLAWTGGWANYEDRVRTLLAPVVNRLNLEDGVGAWSVLHKSNRGPVGIGFIPYDVIVWTATKEHFDIFTDEPKALWQPNGVYTDSRWRNMTIGEARAMNMMPPVPPRPGEPNPVPDPDPEPEPTPEPFPIVDLERLLEDIHADNLAIIKGNSDILSRLQDMELILKNSDLTILMQPIAETIQRELEAVEFVGRNRFLGEIVLTPRRR